MSVLYSSKFKDSKKIITILGLSFSFGWWPVCSKIYDFGINLPSFIKVKYLYILDFIEFASKYIDYSDYDFEGEKFILDYKKLISGLDEKSIINVNNAISVYKKYSCLKKQKHVSISDLEFLYNLLSPTEDEKLFIKNNFYSNIVKVDKDSYAYENYLLPRNHFESSVFYHRHSIDELSSLNLIKEKSIIDVGGFIGDSALVFSAYTNKFIYSFEASPENFYLLQKTIAMNNLKNVIPVQKALGSQVAQKLCICGNGSCTKISEDYEKAKSSLFAIESTTLDSFVEENHIDVGLIKVDIEGFEQEFLKGAENTIKTQRPALLISIYHKPEDYLYIKPIIESWNLGYKFRIICPPENRLFETLLVAEVA